MMAYLTTETAIPITLIATDSSYMPKSSRREDIENADAAAIVNKIETWAAAIRVKDIDKVMSFYAHDIVSFDVEAPLQYVGFDAKRKRWIDTFALYKHILDYETRSLTIVSSNDLAFGYSMNRLHGILANGQTSGFWLRWTLCLRKLHDDWLIAHEQISAPIDPKSGAACLNLHP